MKRLIVSCSVTLDGFMAGPGLDLDSLDFVAADSQLEDELAATLATDVDAVVLGRRAYLEMAAYWTKVDSEMAGWLTKTPKIVLSTDPSFDVGGWDNSTLAAGDGVERVRRLKASPGGALVTFGGVRTLRQLIAADLVDEYWLRISPTVVGRGGSMFADLAGQRTLDLLTVKAYPSGSIAANYAA